MAHARGGGRGHRAPPLYQDRLSYGLSQLDLIGADRPDGELPLRNERPGAGMAEVVTEFSRDEASGAPGGRRVVKGRTAPGSIRSPRLSGRGRKVQRPTPYVKVRRSPRSVADRRPGYRRPEGARETSGRRCRSRRAAVFAGKYPNHSENRAKIDINRIPRNTDRATPTSSPSK